METSPSYQLQKWVTEKPIDHNRVNELLKECIKTNQYTNNGPNVKLLEKYIVDKFEIDNHTKSVICVCNATVALWCLCNAIEMTDYLNTDNIQTTIKWTTQSFTFPSSAQGMLKDTYIVDIDNDGGLDLELVPSDSNGIIVTNIFGNVVDIDKYIDWAKTNNKYLLFDNAATAYTFYKGKNSCNYGNGSIISFHHTKPFGFGEGGAIIVDKKYEENVRRLINFGIQNEKHLPWQRIGGNYKISDISAIYILQYLEKYFDKIVEHHIKMYNIYCDKYAMYPNFGDKNKTVLSCFCLLDHDKYTINYIDCMVKNGITCRKYYNPLIPTKIATSLYNAILCYPLNLDINSICLI